MIRTTMKKTGYEVPDGLKFKQERLQKIESEKKLITIKR